MSEKTEDATDHKLEEARRKGEVAHSADLTSAVALAAVVASLQLTAPTAADHVRSLMQLAVAPLAEAGPGEWEVLVGRMQVMLEHLAWISAPLVLALLAGTLVAGFAQVGLQFSAEPLAPKPDRIDPVAGFKRLFSLRSLLEVLKSLLKLAVIGTVMYGMVRSIASLSLKSVYGSAAAIGAVAWSSLLHLLWVCAAAFLVVGLADHLVQKWLFERDHRMSKDEVTREYKEMEGDPHLKAERKSIGRELAMSDPTPAVSGASAVVVNPTHFAVALRFVPEVDTLPVIVAKGADGRALEIRRIAARFGVPVISHPPLARALFKSDERSQVPEPLLEAVAIVLTWAEQVRGAAAP